MRAAPLLALSLVSCSWTVFDQLKADTPVTAFTNRSFGARVGIATDRAGNAILGTGGVPPEGARFYSLLDGRSEPPGTPLTNEPVCELRADLVTSGRPCLPASTLPPAGVLVDPVAKKDHPGCFGVGYGKASQDPGIVAGPIVACTDGWLFTMKGPEGDFELTKSFASFDGAAIARLRIAMATVPRGDAPQNPPLLLGSEVDEAAWVYPEVSAQNAPTLLVGATGTKGERFGASVAIAKIGAGFVYLVSAPPIGKVFAYVDGAKPEDPKVHVGCLSGENGFAETIAVGDVDNDGVQDVLVSEKETVRVFLGKDAPTAPSATECGASWPASSIVLRCAETGAASGCNGSDFGRSIAVGDFDADGKSDVAVGAPFAAAEGVAQAGVVFLFTPSASPDVRDVRYLGKVEPNSGFGWSVASGRVGAQDTLAIGARGKGVSYVQWCTGLPNNPGGPRCRK